MSDQVKPKFEGLLQRVRSALILLPFVIAPVVFGGWSFTILLAVAGFLMAREWGAILGVSQKQAQILGALTVLVLAFGWLLGATEALSLCFVLAGLASSLALWRGERLSPIAGGLFYVALPLVTAQYFREDALGMLVIAYVLISVWAVDIFAMFTGKLVGGPKLAPVVSPNKTWSGLAGGVVGACIGGILTFLVVVGFGFEQADFTALMIIAPLLAICAQGADLFESAIKRKYDVKDSGDIIPGHGGLLDRVDGLIGVLIVLLGVVWLRGDSVSAALWIW
ncbi:MAG: phosphatidate cytidylyltransferase [Rhodobiaceae bacterium]|nr:phosphatidate cytidylyltransferase [Rhodobiaceae bacterium]